MFACKRGGSFWFNSTSLVFQKARGYCSGDGKRIFLDTSPSVRKVGAIGLTTEHIEEVACIIEDDICKEFKVPHETEKKFARVEEKFNVLQNENARLHARVEKFNAKQKMELNIGKVRDEINKKILDIAKEFEEENTIIGDEFTKLQLESGKEFDAFKRQVELVKYGTLKHVVWGCSALSIAAIAISLLK